MDLDDGETRSLRCRSTVERCCVPRVGRPANRLRSSWSERCSRLNSVTVPARASSSIPNCARHFRCSGWRRPRRETALHAAAVFTPCGRRRLGRRHVRTALRGQSGRRRGRAGAAAAAAGERIGPILLWVSVAIGAILASGIGLIIGAGGFATPTIGAPDVRSGRGDDGDLPADPIRPVSASAAGGGRERLADCRTAT